MFAGYIIILDSQIGIDWKSLIKVCAGAVLVLPIVQVESLKRAVVC